MEHGPHETNSTEKQDKQKIILCFVAPLCTNNGETLIKVFSQVLETNFLVFYLQKI